MSVICRPSLAARMKVRANIESCLFNLYANIVFYDNISLYMHRRLGDRRSWLHLIIKFLYRSHHLTSLGHPDRQNLLSYCMLYAESLHEK